MGTRRFWISAIVGLLFAGPSVAAADEIDGYGTAGLFTLTASSVTQVITLSGQMVQTVHIPPNGQAGDSNKNGLDDVSAEITSLSLSGMSSLGLVQLTLDSSSISAGSIEETANAVSGFLDVPPFAASGTANMEFDIFLSMTIGGGPTLTSQGSAHVSALIGHKPAPNVDDLWSSMTSVDFVDSGRPAGVSLGRCTPLPGIACPAVPEPGTFVLLGGGAVAFGLLRARRATH